VKQLTYINQSRLPKLYKNKFFENLCEQLEELKIITFSKSNSNKKVEILDYEFLIQLLSIFIFRRNILLLSQEKSSSFYDIIYKNGYLCCEICGKDTEYSIFFPLKRVIKRKNTSLFNKLFDMEDTDDLVNSILGIFIGSFQYWKSVYNNTYISEWAKGLSEFDVFAISDNPPFCLIIETFFWNLSKEDISESRLSHFKKHIFDIWMVEKFFNIKVKSIYLDLGFNLFKSQKNFLNWSPLKEFLIENRSVKYFSLSSYFSLSNRSTPQSKIIDWNKYILSLKKLIKDIEGFVKEQGKVN